MADKCKCRIVLPGELYCGQSSLFRKIKFCPKHAAVDVLVKALKSIEGMGDVMSGASKFDMRRVAEAALRKAGEL